MVKRAGIEPTPQGTIGNINVESGATGYLAAADVWNTIGNTARQVRESVKPILVDAAKRKAGKAVLAGDFTQQRGWTDEQRAYNNVVEAGYMAKTQNDVDTRLSQIELDHSEDVEGFTAAADSVKSTLLDGMDANYAVAVSEYVDGRIARGLQRVAERRQGTAVKESEAAIRARLDVLDAQHSELLPSDPEWQAYILQRDVIQESLKNPLFGIPDEALEADSMNVISRAEANAIGQTAYGMYDSADDKVTGAADALAFISEQYKRTDLTLTPAQRDQHMGEARRRIQGAETERRRVERELKAESRALIADLTVDVRDEQESLSTLMEAHQMPPPERIAAYVRAAEATGRPGLINAARDIEAKHAAVSSLRGLTGARASETMAEWFAAANAGDVSAARRYTAGAQYLQETQTQMRTKPLEFLRDWSGEAIAQIDTVDGWRARIEQGSRAAEMAGGVEPQFLLAGEKAMLAAMSDRGGDEAFQVAAQIATAGSREQARAIFSEIGPNGPALGYAGMVLVDTGDRDAARRILLGQQQLRRAGSTGDGGYRPADMKADDRDRAIELHMATGLTGQQIADRRRATDLLFEGQYAETGDSSRQAYERAAATVSGAVDVNGVRFGGVTAMRGARVPVPSWIKASEFKNIVSWSLTAGDFVAASETGAAPVARSPGGRRAPASLSQLRQFHLIPSGAPGRYRLTTSPTPDAAGEWQWLNDENGQPYTLNLNKIRGALAARMPGAVMPEPANGR